MTGQPMPGIAAKTMPISIKRAYAEPAPEDGYRVLVDRIWPRGLSRAALALDEWAKELAPSPGLRKWFGHDPKRWEGFRQRYRAELAEPQQKASIEALLAAARNRRITLVYGAKDEEHNQAVVLRDVLSHMMPRR